MNLQLKKKKKKKRRRSKQTKAIIHIDDQKVANQVHETPTIGEKRTKAINREREKKKVQVKNQLKIKFEPMKKNI